MSQALIAFGGSFPIIILFIIINWESLSTVRKILYPMAIYILSVLSGIICVIAFDINNYKTAFIAGIIAPIAYSILFTILSLNNKKSKNIQLNSVIVSIFILIVSSIFTVISDENDFSFLRQKEVKWTPIINNDYGCVITFPDLEGGIINESEVILENTNFGDLLVKSYDLNCQKIEHENLAYALTIITIPEDSVKKMTDSFEREYFNTVETYITDFTGSERVTRKVIDIQGYPAREFWFHNKHNHLKIKAISILKNNIEYRYFVIMGEDDFLNYSIGSFMNSFIFY